MNRTRSGAGGTRSLIQRVITSKDSAAASGAPVDYVTKVCGGAIRLSTSRRPGVPGRVKLRATRPMLCSSSLAVLRRLSQMDVRQAHAVATSWSPCDLVVHTAAFARCRGACGFIHFQHASSERCKLGALGVAALIGANREHRSATQRTDPSNARRRVRARMVAWIRHNMIRQ